MHSGVCLFVVLLLEFRLSSKVFLPIFYRSSFLRRTSYCADSRSIRACIMNGIHTSYMTEFDRTSRSRCVKFGLPFRQKLFPICAAM